MDDDELLDLIQAAEGDDPLPERALEGARSAWDWTLFDEVVAALVEDGAELGDAVRDTRDGRRLVYETDDAIADVELRGGRVRILVDPPATVTLERPDGMARSLSDEPVTTLDVVIDPGPVRLRIGGPSGWVTGWFTA